MTWLIAAVDSVIGLLRSVDVAYVRVSEAHVTSIIIVEVFKVVKFETEICATYTSEMSTATFRSTSLRKELIPEHYFVIHRDVIDC
jgi:hypothetical protein